MSHTSAEEKAVRDSVPKGTNLAEAAARDMKPKVGEVKRLTLEGRTYVLRWTRCGRPACRKCPHGPYWEQRFQARGRNHVIYIGLDLTAGLLKRRLTEALGERQQGLLPGIEDVAPPGHKQRPKWISEEAWEMLLDDVGGTLLKKKQSEKRPLPDIGQCAAEG